MTFRGHRIVRQDYNVFQLLAGVLERLVDQAYLLPRVEAKLIAAMRPPSSVLKPTGLALRMTIRL